MAVKVRYSAGEIALRNAAEEEILRFKDSTYLWAKHVLGVTLDPHQCVYVDYFESHQNCLLIGSRRIRKSFAVSMWLLKEAATKRQAEINVHSPTVEQSKRNLQYMTDKIIDSEMLLAYIENRIGDGLGREKIEFQNKSKIQAKGQASSTDGLGATHQWWEELDDMDWETILTRIYPTGSQIKPDFDYGKILGCRRVATGTIKGKGNIFRLEHPEKNTPFNFTVLPKLDAWYGVAAGLIPEADIITARDALMTPAQFARTYLALYTESRDYFPTNAINACCRSELAPARPARGDRYAQHGPVTFGMDFEGHSEDDEEGSKTSIVFIEQPIPGEFIWLYGKEWPIGTPPDEIREEVIDLCLFFRPESGAGDAYDATLLYDLNRDLNRIGLVKEDVANFENRDGASGWEKWPVQPIRFEGFAKHRLYQKLQSNVLKESIGWPMDIEGAEDYRWLAKFLAQLENVRALPTQMGYDSFKLYRKAIGDDLVAAAALALWKQRDHNKKKVRAAGGGARMGGFRTGQRFAPRQFRR